MPNLLIVDRIEGDFAVCQDEERHTQTLPLASLPPGVREGDCLRPVDGGWVVDAEETARRRSRNRELFDRLLRRPPRQGG